MADGGYDNYIASVKVNDGEWHYVVFSVRRIANGGAIFVDDNPPMNFTPRMGSLANDQPLVIGRFDGCIDELQVYRFTAPDRDAITTRFDCKSSCVPPLPELAESGGAWWRFDEPIGTASRDAFGSEANNLSRYAVACARAQGFARSSRCRVDTRSITRMTDSTSSSGSIRRPRMA